MEKQQIEKIFNRFCTLVNKDYNEYRIRDKEGFIKAIASNKASQFVQSSIPEISNEEIEKEFPLLKGFNPVYNENMLFAQKGAKWYRTRQRELKGEEKK